MNCWHCERPAHGACRFCGRGVCKEHTKSMPFVLATYSEKDSVKAVVVDDAFQGITEVVRGSDLLESTARQIHLQHALGLPTPVYLHHPIATGVDGRKLGKRFRSDPVGSLPAAEAVSVALQFLGQKPPGGMELKELWSWACEHWQAEYIPGVECMRVELSSQA